MSTLKAVMEEKVNVKNVDFAVLKSPKFQVYDAKKIQEIIDRVLLVGDQSLVDDVFQLPVGLAQQALQRNRCFETTVLQ